MYRLVSAVRFTQASEAFGAVARFPLDAPGVSCALQQHSLDAIEKIEIKQ